MKSAAHSHRCSARKRLTIRICLGKIASELDETDKAFEITVSNHIPYSVFRASVELALSQFDGCPERLTALKILKANYDILAMHT